MVQGQAGVQSTYLSPRLYLTIPRLYGSRRPRTEGFRGRQLVGDGVRGEVASTRVVRLFKEGDEFSLVNFTFKDDKLINLLNHK